MCVEGGVGGGGGVARHDHTSVRDKMFVCQLSYSLGHICPLNECLSTDFNGFYRCLWGRGGEIERFLHYLLHY